MDSEDDLYEYKLLATSSKTKMLFEYLRQLIADVFWLTDDVLEESQKHKGMYGDCKQEWIQRGGWKAAGVGDRERLHKEESQLGDTEFCNSPTATREECKGAEGSGPPMAPLNS